MTSAIVTDLEQTTYDRQRAVRQMVDATRALPPRTDVPLVPVPFERRMESPLWDSFKPKPRPRETEPARRFTDDEVREIRQARREGARIADIAREFDAAHGKISAIVNRREYKHVSDFGADEQALIDELERRADEAIAQIRAEHQRMRDAIQRGKS